MNKLTNLTELARSGRLSETGRANALTIGISVVFLALAFCYPHFAVGGQSYNQPPAPTPQPPPTVIMVPPQPPPFRPPVVVPTDVTSPQLMNLPTTFMVNSPATAFALGGIMNLNNNEFPTGSINQVFDWITVKAKEGTEYTKPNNYTVVLKQGDILVSVKQPSKLALIETPLGTIAVGANGDVMVSYHNGVLRVLNFDGEGKTIKCQLDKGPFAGPQDPTVSLACGYELVGSTEKITRTTLRPKDGIARRYSKVLENGHMAIAEFSLESALNSCDMLVDLQQKVSGLKERRMLADMSKMAAVLNYNRGGTQGFSVEK